MAMSASPDRNKNNNNCGIDGSETWYCTYAHVYISIHFEYLFDLTFILRQHTVNMFGFGEEMECG